MENRQIASVAKTFEGKTVLLTGATGFLGKLTVETLLRTCPNIKRIYILIRTKNGKDHIQRRNKVLECEIFEPLKKKVIENIEEKVEVIAGDLAVSQLGISPADQKKILEETNFVFHIAATVNFDEKIKKAVEINIKGTKDILKLAKQMKYLQGFVYVSTAYSNCPRHEIEEKFYNPPYEVDKIINIVDSLDDDLLQYLTPKMLKDWPNTYVFTKSIAEHVVKTESDGLPLCIVRPSIVMPTYQEPLSGWAGNLYGPIGITVGVAMGLLKALYIKPLNVADIVPADFVVNCIISAAWDISIDREPATYSGNKDNRIKIYNYVSGPQNPVLWEKTWKYTETLGKSIPSKTCLWYYFFVPAPSERIYKIYITFLHIIPAYIVDFVAMLTGRKPQLVKTYKKIHKFCDVLQYFTTRQWKFENENTKNLWKKLNAEDKTVFPFSMKLLNWKDYFEVCIRGVRLYIFKDPMDTLEEGKAHYRRLKIYHYSVITIVIILLIAFVYYFFKTVFNILF